MCVREVIEDAPNSLFRCFPERITLKSSVHTKIIYFILHFQVDVVSPWEYLHADVAAARLSLSVNSIKI